MAVAVVVVAGVCCRCPALSTACARVLLNWLVSASSVGCSAARNAAPAPAAGAVGVLMGVVAAVVGAMVMAVGPVGRARCGALTVRHRRPGGALISGCKSRVFAQQCMQQRAWVAMPGSVCIGAPAR